MEVNANSRNSAPWNVPATDRCPWYLWLEHKSAHVTEMDGPSLAWNASLQIQLTWTPGRMITPRKYTKLSASALIFFALVFLYSFSRGWMGFPDGSVVKNLLANAEDMGSIPGSVRTPGEENSNTF